MMEKVSRKTGNEHEPRDKDRGRRVVGAPSSRLVSTEEIK